MMRFNNYARGACVALAVIVCVGCEEGHQTLNTIMHNHHSAAIYELLSCLLNADEEYEHGKTCEDLETRLMMEGVNIIYFIRKNDGLSGCAAFSRDKPWLYIVYVGGARQILRGTLATKWLYGSAIERFSERAGWMAQRNQREGLE